MPHKKNPSWYAGTECCIPHSTASTLGSDFPIVAKAGLLGERSISTWFWEAPPKHGFLATMFSLSPKTPATSLTFQGSQVAQQLKALHTQFVITKRYQSWFINLKRESICLHTADHCDILQHIQTASYHIICRVSSSNARAPEAWIVRCQQCRRSE